MTAYPLYLTTGRVLYQYHTGTMTMKIRGLNTLVARVFCGDLAGGCGRYGVEDGQEVRVVSRRGEIKAKAKISDKAVDGTVFIPFHWAEAAANELTHSALDPIAKIPEFKVCAVRIEAA